jgi:hypothetical protein
MKDLYWEEAMKRTIMSAAVVAFLTTLGPPATAQDLGSQIVGMWKFASNEIKEVGTGKVTKPYGEKPNGYIIYTKGGRYVFVLFGDSRSKPGGAAATDAERVKLFNTLAAGSATYKVEGNTLTATFDSSWHELWTGTTQKML